jgi:hypothetical protein
MKIEIKNSSKEDYDLFLKLLREKNLIKLTQLDCRGISCTKNLAIGKVSFEESEKEKNVIIDLEEIRFLNFTVKV